MATEMNINAEQWDLNDEAANKLRKEIFQMDTLLNATSIELNVPRPFYQVEYDKLALDQFKNRGKRALPTKTGGPNPVRTITRYNQRPLARKPVHLPNAPTPRMNRLATLGLRLSTIPRSVNTLVRLPNEMRMHFLPQGLDVGSRIGMQTLMAAPRSFTRLLKWTGRTGVTAAATITTTVAFLYAYNAIFSPKNEPFPGSNSTVEEFEKLYKQFEKQGDLFLSSIGKDNQNVTLGNVIKALGVDMVSFTEKGAEIKESIRLNMQLVHEAKRGHISYLPAGESVWNNIKKIDGVSANWNPEVDGAQAKYNEDKNMITIWAPADCQ